MTGEELTQNYPLAKIAIENYFRQLILNEIADNSEETTFIHSIERWGVPDKMLYDLIDTNAHALFEMFDSHGVYIVISIATTNPETIISFNSSIYIKDYGTVIIGAGFLNREEAERAGIEKAFKMLNDHLSQD